MRPKLAQNSLKLNSALENFFHTLQLWPHGTDTTNLVTAIEKGINDLRDWPKGLFLYTQYLREYLNNTNDYRQYKNKNLIEILSKSLIGFLAFNKDAKEFSKDTYQQYLKDGYLDKFGNRALEQGWFYYTVEKNLLLTDDLLEKLNKKLDEVVLRFPAVRSFQENLIKVIPKPALKKIAKSSWSVSFVQFLLGTAIFNAHFSKAQTIAATNAPDLIPNMLPGPSANINTGEILQALIHPKKQTIKNKEVKSYLSDYKKTLAYFNSHFEEINFFEIITDKNKNHQSFTYEYFCPTDKLLMECTDDKLFDKATIDKLNNIFNEARKQIIDKEFDQAQIKIQYLLMFFQNDQNDYNPQKGRLFYELSKIYEGRKEYLQAAKAFKTYQFLDPFPIAGEILYFVLHRQADLLAWGGQDEYALKLAELELQYRGNPYWVQQTKVLPEKTADKKDPIVSQQLENSLINAIVLGDLVSLKKEITAAANVNAKWGGTTALHVAARADNTEAIKLLIAAGADLTAFDDDELTPLQIAILTGQVDAATLLLEKISGKQFPRQLFITWFEIERNLFPNKEQHIEDLSKIINQLTQEQNANLNDILGFNYFRRALLRQYIKNPESFSDIQKCLALIIPRAVIYSKYFLTQTDQDLVSAENKVLLDQALKQFPNHYSLKLVKLRQLIQEKQYDETMQLCKEISKVDPNNPDADYYLAHHDINLGEYEAAREKYQSALKKDPEFAAAALGLEELSYFLQKKNSLKVLMESDHHDIIEHLPSLDTPSIFKTFSIPSFPENELLPSLRNNTDVSEINELAQHVYGRPETTDIRYLAFMVENSKKMLEKALQYNLHLDSYYNMAFEKIYRMLGSIYFKFGLMAEAKYNLEMAMLLNTRVAAVYYAYAIIKKAEGNLYHAKLAVQRASQIQTNATLNVDDLESVITVLKTENKDLLGKFFDADLDKAAVYEAGGGLSWQFGNLLQGEKNYYKAGKLGFDSKGLQPVTRYFCDPKKTLHYYQHNQPEFDFYLLTSGKKDNPDLSFFCPTGKKFFLESKELSKGRCTVLNTLFSEASNAIDKNEPDAEWALTRLNHLLIYFDPEETYYNRHLATIFKNIYITYNVKKNYLKALLALDTACNLDPVAVTPVTLMAYAGTLALLERYNEAIDIYEKTSKLPTITPEMQEEINQRIVHLIKRIKILNKKDIPSKRKDHQYPPDNSIISAILDNNYLQVKKLIKTGTDLEAKKDGKTALQVAVQEGQLRMVKALVKAGANLDVVSSDNKTIVEIAIQYAQVDIARFLLEKIADENFPRDYFIVLYEAYIDFALVDNTLIKLQHIVEDFTFRNNSKLTEAIQFCQNLVNKFEAKQKIIINNPSQIPRTKPRGLNTFLGFIITVSAAVFAYFLWSFYKVRHSSRSHKIIPTKFNSMVLLALNLITEDLYEAEWESLTIQCYKLPNKVKIALPVTLIKNNKLWNLDKFTVNQEFLQKSIIEQLKVLFGEVVIKDGEIILTVSNEFNKDFTAPDKTLRQFKAKLLKNLFAESPEFKKSVEDEKKIKEKAGEDFEYKKSLNRLTEEIKPHITHATELKENENFLSYAMLPNTHVDSLLKQFHWDKKTAENLRTYNNSDLDNLNKEIIAIADKLIKQINLFQEEQKQKPYAGVLTTYQDLVEKASKPTQTNAKMKEGAPDVKFDLSSIRAALASADTIYFSDVVSILKTIKNLQAGKQEITVKTEARDVAKQIAKKNQDETVPEEQPEPALPPKKEEQKTPVDPKTLVGKETEKKKPVPNKASTKGTPAIPVKSILEEQPKPALPSEKEEKKIRAKPQTGVERNENEKKKTGPKKASTKGTPAIPVKSSAVSSLPHSATFFPSKQKSSVAKSASEPIVLKYNPEEKREPFCELLHHEILKIENRLIQIDKNEIDIEAELDKLIATHALLGNLLRILEAIRERIKAVKNTEVIRVLRNMITHTVFLPDVNKVIEVARLLKDDWRDKIIEHVQQGTDLSADELTALFAESKLYDFYKDYRGFNADIAKDPILLADICLPPIYANIRDIAKLVKEGWSVPDLRGVPEREDAIRHCLTIIGHCADFLKENRRALFNKLLTYADLKSLLPKSQQVRRDMGHEPKQQVFVDFVQVAATCRSVLKDIPEVLKPYKDLVNVIPPTMTAMQVSAVTIDLLPELIGNLSVRPKEILSNAFTREDLINNQLQFSAMLRQAIKGACQDLSLADQVVLNSICEIVYGKKIPLNDGYIDYCQFKLTPGDFNTICESIKTHGTGKSLKR